jgi:hypothetical protein
MMLQLCTEGVVMMLFKMAGLQTNAYANKRIFEVQINVQLSVTNRFIEKINVASLPMFTDLQLLLVSN